MIPFGDELLLDSHFIREQREFLLSPDISLVDDSYLESMAKVVGLIASIVSIAGAAATVSPTLYNFVGTVRYAKEEFNALAIEALDLSSLRPPQRGPESK